MADSKGPSRLWYLLVIFLGPVGGIVGYFILKNRDKKFAERLLIIGLVMIAVWWVLSIVLAGLAYLYISGTFSAATANVLSIDPSSSCANNVINAVVRNDGTKAAGPVKVGSDGGSCTLSSIPAGSSGSCSLTVSGLGYHSVVASTSSSSVTGNVNC